MFISLKKQLIFNNDKISPPYCRARKVAQCDADADIEPPLACPMSFDVLISRYLHILSMRDDFLPDSGGKAL